jgi:hypothetical protein
VDYLPNLAEPQTELACFARDVALSLSVHRDRSPAVVWPDTTAEEDLDSAALPGLLSGLLGCQVDGRHTGDTRAADLLLLPVRGSCDGRIEPVAAGSGTARTPLSVRLRQGEALYVPRDFRYRLHSAHLPCTLQVLTLHPLTW